jgi:hypothetical protein
VETIDDVKDSLSRNFQRDSTSRFFEQCSSPEHGAELLWPLVPGDLARQGSQARAVSASQDNRPFASLADIYCRGCIVHTHSCRSPFKVQLLNAGFGSVKL